MKVWLIGQPQVDWTATEQWIASLGGEAWTDRMLSGPEYPNGGEALIEAAGRRCYRSFDVGLNPNVTRVRTDSEQYLQEGIIATEHGSVLEHAQFTFAIENCSRVLTHELVRHRVGVAISQESLRYVRLDDIPFWWPAWARDDEELYKRGRALIEQMEDFQIWMASHFDLDGDGVPFKEKKARTSFMRRFAPEGLTTGMVWSANIRTIRHVIKMRGDKVVAEEEIFLFGDVLARIMKEAAPALFRDVQQGDDDVWRLGVKEQ